MVMVMVMGVVVVVVVVVAGFVGVVIGDAAAAVVVLPLLLVACCCLFAAVCWPLSLALSSGIVAVALWTRLCLPIVSLPSCAVQAGDDHER